MFLLSVRPLVSCNVDPMLRTLCVYGLLKASFIKGSPTYSHSSCSFHFRISRLYLFCAGDVLCSWFYVYHLNIIWNIRLEISWVPSPSSRPDQPPSENTCPLTSACGIYGRVQAAQSLEDYLLPTTSPKHRSSNFPHPLTPPNLRVGVPDGDEQINIQMRITPRSSNQ